ncbi:MAG: hypothetical protein QW304_07770 [Thermoproteota archaeon]
MSQPPYYEIPTTYEIPTEYEIPVPPPHSYPEQQATLIILLTLLCD